MIIRHDFDPIEVKDQISKSVKELQNRLNEQINYIQDYYEDPNDPKLKEQIESMKSVYSNMISEQIDHYSTVRVIEFPEGDKRFVLVYGDVSDSKVTSGTGPFSDVETAKTWFMNSGR